MKKRIFELFKTLTIFFEKLIYPNWLKKIDSWLLKNYPIIWITKIYNTFYIFLLINLFLILLLSFFKIEIKYFLFLNYTIPIVYFLAILIAFSTSRNTQKLNKGKKSNFYISRELSLFSLLSYFSLYLFLFLIIISPLYSLNYFINYKVSNSISKDEIIYDINSLNYGIPYVLNQKEKKELYRDKYIFNDLINKDILTKSELVERFEKNKNDKTLILKDIENFLVVIKNYKTNGIDYTAQQIQNSYLSNDTNKLNQISKNFQNTYDFIVENLTLIYNLKNNLYYISPKVVLLKLPITALVFLLVSYIFLNTISLKNNTTRLNLNPFYQLSISFIIAFPFFYILAIYMAIVSEQNLTLNFIHSLTLFGMFFIYIISFFYIFNLNSFKKLKYFSNIKFIFLNIFITYTLFIPILLNILYFISIQEDLNSISILLNFILAIILLTILIPFIYNREKILSSLPRR